MTIQCYFYFLLESCLELAAVAGWLAGHLPLLFICIFYEVLIYQYQKLLAAGSHINTCLYTYDLGEGASKTTSWKTMNKKKSTQKKARTGAFFCLAGQTFDLQPPWGGAETCGRFFLVVYLSFDTSCEDYVLQVCKSASLYVCNCGGFGKVVFFLLVVWV
ncbi:hypothetical protein BZA05DRAFT_8144 [Tricharina praecox]|uniref:uncharacterized protein n=1 Tax=Tricharina praecox TaxID=43433 RepID=UPI0022202E92|nr:uncharacterized protein BZA05DRAFT_8144 [Tricharina praecox]KAI5858582.1 hypothetical protein BZA05DRAFT_8144 [Tricharina praecox]